MPMALIQATGIRSARNTGSNELTATKPTSWRQRRLTDRIASEESGGGAIARQIQPM